MKLRDYFHDREWWDELLFTCKVYGIFMLTFVLPMLLVYVVVLWAVSKVGL